jgi:hypothetical protein
MTDVTGGIGTGIATRGMWEISRAALKRAASWRYKQVFGRDAAEGNLHLIYALLNPPKAVNASGAQVKHIFSKSGDESSRFSISEAVSVCEVRAVTYLAESVASNTGSWVALKSDKELGTKLDLSCISLGVLSNNKTIDLLHNDGNPFADFRDGRFVTKLTGRTIIAPSTDPKIDYGMILKIHPASAPERNWICCGGYDEWGTSGAARYLAHRWRDIRKKFGNRPFVIFVRVEPGRDESADDIISAATPEKLEKQARST